MPSPRELVAVSRSRRSVIAVLVAVAVPLVVPVGAGPAAADADGPAAGAGVRPEEGEIARLYAAVFGRDPDPAGRSYWLVQRTSGLSLADIASLFVASDEYRERFGVDADADFVARLYLNVLGRRPDERGADYWQSQLASGLDRRQVVVLFSESEEFVASTGTAPRGPAELAPFIVEQRPVTAASLGASWRPGCPVGPEDLVELAVPHVTLDGAETVGRLIVHHTVVDDVTTLFEVLHRHRMPVEQIVPASAFGGDDLAIMDANVTSAFNCRAVTGGTAWSRHAYGTAIDLNPAYNPYVKGSQVLPERGRPFVDRSVYHPLMLRSGDPFVSTARHLGWRWGGDWSSLRDYQHIDVSPPR